MVGAGNAGVPGRLSSIFRRHGAGDAAPAAGAGPVKEEAMEPAASRPVGGGDDVLEAGAYTRPLLSST
jgi:hypothetical protein